MTTSHSRQTFWPGWSEYHVLLAKSLSMRSLIASINIVIGDDQAGDAGASLPLVSEKPNFCSLLSILVYIIPA